MSSPADLDHAARITLAAFFGDRDLQAAAQILCRQTLCRFDDLGRMPFDDHFTATNTRTRPEIDQVIALAHRVFIVLDHDDGIPDIAKVLKRADQAIVIARMEANRWLVQNVKNSNQSGTDLTGQANPLGLATRQSRRGAIEHQII